MATLSRRPLVPRPLLLQIPSVRSPLKATKTASGSAKRSRSPDLIGDCNASNSDRKRVRAVVDSTATATREKDRERRHAERQQQKTEFKEKYRRAFPSWTFYFDSDSVEVDNVAVKGILELGGRIEDFFSNAITHLITNHTVPTSFTADIAADKENVPGPKASLSRSASLLKSPIQLGGLAAEDAGYDLVTKAIFFGMKIWSTSKLDSVLERCIDVSIASTSTNSRAASLVTPATASTRQRSLIRLLQSERLHGSSERDPTQKRHDFQYFSRSSCFVLIEDMRQELATIAAEEYPMYKGREGARKVPWPVLHCHPHSRGPFIAFDEKEKKRWEKMQRAELEKEGEREERRTRTVRVEQMKRRADAHIHTRRNGDLRRSVSMSNLHRRAAHPDSVFDGTRMIDLDDTCDNPDSAHASGYLASGTGGGYIAASGNSVGITSTTGTTSTAAGQTLRSLQLPAVLRGQIQHQVLTSRKFSLAAADKSQKGAGLMGPPVKIPERPQMLLRKSRSTNTLKLPKREEGSKPGYCESCRTKFDSFQCHTMGRKHRKFAMDDTNFLQLDYILGRVKRRTVHGVDDEWGNGRGGAKSMTRTEMRADNL